MFTQWTKANCLREVHNNDNNNKINNNNIKQSLNEVEHDIMNYQNRGLCYLRKPKAMCIGEY